MEDTSLKLHYQTYLDELISEIRECAAEESLQPAFAAERVIAQRLGYEIDDIEFIDGAGDRGIDFWYTSEDGLYVFQVKTRQISDRGIFDYETSFDVKGVTDLRRAYEFLISPDEPKEQKLIGIKDALNRLVKNYAAQETEVPIPIRLTLVILGKTLTDQAFTELADFEHRLEKSFIYEGVPLQFYVDFQTIDNVLEASWRERNDSWNDKDGHKVDSIRLTPMRQTDKQHYLHDNQSAIFYCLAVDLVNAYRSLGYQIFEPNVRAHINNSSVNHAIQQSATKTRSMKEFRFLNNGLTITCNNYKLPSGQRPEFEVVHPGIVNGLQTVVALERAYKSLPEYQKHYFEENCFVLVRLLRNDSVDEIAQVVFATNNQNPMQRRNLVSNTAEQIEFIHLFAEHLRWFYEAKQGAWHAFREKEQQWRPRINLKERAFKAKVGYKIINNQDLARDWLAFLGFADKATNEKKSLFDEPYYKLIFLSKQQQHAFGTYETIEQALKDSNSEAPDAYTMLSAYLAHGFASKAVPSSSANRKAALAKKGVVTGTKSFQEEEKILREDGDYVLNQILYTMSLVFVEFVGFTLFAALGPDAHRCGQLLLRTRSWSVLANNFDLRAVTENLNDVEDDDLLIIMWLFFREAVETLMGEGGKWRDAYRNERYKPRFVLRHRGDLYLEVKKMDEAIRKKVQLRIWSNSIREKEGFFGYIRRILETLWNN